MTQGVYGTGTSALLAYQRAMQVIGNNIANVNTDGFSRQRVELATRPADRSGVGSIGNGVQIAGVTRTVDQFVQQRLEANTSASAEHSRFREIIESVDNLLGDETTGLSPALSRFFNAVEEVAADPTSTAARQLMISEGRSLADRFAQLDSHLNAQQTALNGQIRGTVAEINHLTGGIADLNKAIVDARGRAGGQPPNDLLDERDSLVTQLSELTEVRTVPESDGSLNVYGGRGQTLVTGTRATALFAEPRSADPTRLDIGYNNGNVEVISTDLMRGGRLGALLEARDEVLDPVGNALGRMAVALADEFNSVHNANLDLTGALGEDFFTVPPPVVQTAAGNAATGQPAVSIEAVGDLTTHDYELRYDGDDWIMRRRGDGEVVGSAAPGGTIDTAGLHVDLGGVTGAAEGDSFVLQPLKSAAAGLDVAISDPRAVAAALPVRAAAAPGNTGGAAVDSLSVTDAGNADLRAPAAIAFTGGEFVVDGETFALDPGGETVIEHNGWQLTITGEPAEGDTFDVTDNAGGVGDNRGARALADIADRRILSGGTATLAEGYAELMADVGVKTRRAQINAQTHERLLADAQAQRESVSGVNLDEEAANLMRMQQAYQASAQVIATAGTMFDSLLAAFRR